VGLLAGANVQPILTGAGYLKFPENPTSAYLFASGGALTAQAGGSNQNLILNSSGTGTVYLGKVGGQPVYVGNPSTVTPYYSFALGDYSASANNQLFLKRPGAATNGFELNSDLNGAFHLGYMGDSGSSIAANIINVTYTGFAGFGGNTGPNYSVDATGDINTSTSYRVGGVQGKTVTYAIPGGGSITFTGGIPTATTAATGLTGTYTVRNSAGTGTCTLTFSNGGLTAETC
jgi:hypothetical protein